MTLQKQPIFCRKQPGGGTSGLKDTSVSSSQHRGETKQPNAAQTASVMPSIQPRPNLHAQHHNLDTLERMVFEDFNGSPYASKSTIVISAWDSICCNCKLVRRKLEYVDPRGYINITWLFVQVRENGPFTHGMNIFCNFYRIILTVD